MIPVPEHILSRLLVVEVHELDLPVLAQAADLIGVKVVKSVVVGIRMVQL